MANIKLLVPKILKWEGGYVNDPKDPGGATNMGVTIGTWKTVGYDKNHDGKIDETDIKLLTPDDATMVLKKFYWDKIHGDDITSQSIAEIWTDWVWASGSTAIKRVQKILGISPDGNVGQQTLSLVNTKTPKELFESIKQDRLSFIDQIIKVNPNLEKFRKGWINRINSYTFNG